MAKVYTTSDGKILMRKNGGGIISPQGLANVYHGDSLPPVYTYNTGDVFVTGDNAKAYVAGTQTVSQFPISSGGNVYIALLEGDDGIFRTIGGGPSYSSANDHWNTYPYSLFKEAVEKALDDGVYDEYDISSINIAVANRKESGIVQPELSPTDIRNLSSATQCVASFLEFSNTPVIMQSVETEISGEPITVESTQEPGVENAMFIPTIGIIINDDFPEYYTNIGDNSNMLFNTESSLLCGMVIFPFQNSIWTSSMDISNSNVTTINFAKSANTTDIPSASFFGTPSDEDKNNLWLRFDTNTPGDNYTGSEDFLRLLLGIPRSDYANSWWSDNISSSTSTPTLEIGEYWLNDGFKKIRLAPYEVGRLSYRTTKKAWLD